MASSMGGEIQNIFNAVDKDRSGHVDAKELQEALGKGGFILSLTAIAQLIRLHDRDNDGRINFQEFAALHNYLGEAQAAFLRAGGSPDVNQISSTQLKSALESLGFTWIDPPAFTSLCRAFDPTFDGTFGLTEFFAMTAFLKSVTATFRGFEQAQTGPQRGFVSLSLNQFLYAASNTR